ncbi:MAG: aldehyde dehydrogenase [Gammaproteobacteria bacterium]|nr:aldehyde dehydrogenase [Gammaproteobacteria bacterium]
MTDNGKSKPALPQGIAVPERVRCFIGGKSVAGTGIEIPIIYPATEAVIGTLEEAAAAEVDAAVAAARDAFDHGPWPQLGIPERKAMLHSIRSSLLENAEELAFLECLDTGVPIRTIRGRKMDRLTGNFELFAESLSMMAGQTYQQDRKFLTMVTHEPVGVAALIAPWNSPLSLATTKLAPCIAYGNTCVLKPSEHTPMALARMVEILHEAGLPDGVVNLVNGRGPVTGAALVEHPGVDLVSFTGGTETGRSVMSSAAGNLAPVALELGGKSANIITETADFEQALDGALLAIYSNNGQQCLAGSRILVQRSIADRFIERFVERAGQIRLGDPMDPDCEMGPLAFREHFEKVLSYVDIARAEGAELLVGGKRAEGFEAGYYFEPTAVLAPSNGLRVCQEEIFGPFAAIQVYDSLDEAIAIANDTEFGLVAYVWSEDLHTITRATQALRAGTVWVNTPLVREVRAPFGGYKSSGVGRDGVRDCLDFFTEQKTTQIPVGKLSLARLGAGS